MGKILKSYLTPHPPIIIPEIGKGEEWKCSETINSLKAISSEISSQKPSTVIFITPHGTVFSDAISILTEGKLTGSFKKFGNTNIRLDYQNNLELAAAIIGELNKAAIPTATIDKHTAKSYNTSSELDHGVLVPLYYISQFYSNFKLLHITIGFLSVEELYKAGIAISKAVKLSDENIILIASGDLSHRLTPQAPAGYNPLGIEYDNLLINKIKEADIEGILNIREDFLENAGECGHRPLIMLLGANDGFKLSTQVYSYQGPFGVGYAVASFQAGLPDSKDFLNLVKIKKGAEINKIRENEDAYVQLARTALETYILKNKTIEPPQGLADEIRKHKSGVFVSIKKNSKLRGCIGTIYPTQHNIAQEIIHNAISSGTRDPRFDPVQAEELSELVYSVDVLMPPEPINNISGLDVIKYGVIVSSQNKRGLLLPNLEGIETSEQQVAIALQKAGIKPHEHYTMERFEVIRHK